MTNENSEFQNKSVAFTGKGIELYRLLALRTAIRSEIRGMKMTRGRTAYAIVKSELGFKGTKEKVLAQLEALIKDKENTLPEGDIKEI